MNPLGCYFIAGGAANGKRCATLRCILMSTACVAVLGASPKTDRKSNQALHCLRQHGHKVIPVHPVHQAIDGIPVTKDLAAIDGPVDILTVYVGPRHGEELIDQIIGLAPGRVILNPGAESELVERRLRESGISVIRACTMVLLASGQFPPREAQ